MQLFLYILTIISFIRSNTYANHEVDDDNSLSVGERNLDNPLYATPSDCTHATTFEGSTFDNPLYASTEHPIEDSTYTYIKTAVNSTTHLI